MNLKTNVVIGLLVILAVFFVPIIPNDAPINCDSYDEECDDVVGYVSLYAKYFK